MQKWARALQAMKAVVRAGTELRKLEVLVNKERPSSLLVLLD